MGFEPIKPVEVYAVDDDSYCTELECVLKLESERVNEGNSFTNAFCRTFSFSKLIAMIKGTKIFEMFTCVNVF